LQVCIACSGAEAYPAERENQSGSIGFRRFQAIEKATAVAAPTLLTTKAVVFVFSSQVFENPATYVRAPQIVAITLIRENTA
jgi:hypothetical protein